MGDVLRPPPLLLFLLPILMLKDVFASQLTPPSQLELIPPNSLACFMKFAKMTKIPMPSLLSLLLLLTSRSASLDKWLKLPTTLMSSTTDLEVLKMLPLLRTFQKAPPSTPNSPILVGNVTTTALALLTWEKSLLTEPTLLAS